MEPEELKTLIKKKRQEELQAVKEMWGHQLSLEEKQAIAEYHYMMHAEDK